jgi:hypothetical protein
MKTRHTSTTSVEPEPLVDDDQGFQPGHVDGGPVYARDLLGLLGVASAPARVQKSAVKAWLKTHTPGASLRRSLRRSRLI